MIFNAWKSLSDGQSLCSANRVVVQSHHPGPDCLRELDSLALWLKEPTGQNTLILEVSSLRCFLRKASWFSARQFLHPLPYFASQSIHCNPGNRAKTVQKPCTYSGTNKKRWFLIHDLVAIWVTTKVNLIHGKKNAHPSEEFSGEWAVLRRRLI